MDTGSVNTYRAPLSRRVGILVTPARLAAGVTPAPGVHTERNAVAAFCGGLLWEAGNLSITAGTPVPLVVLRRRSNNQRRGTRHPNSGEVSEEVVRVEK